jgi:hypothetical protein
MLTTAKMIIAAAAVAQATDAATPFAVATAFDVCNSKERQQQDAKLDFERSYKTQQDLDDFVRCLSRDIGSPVERCDLDAIALEVRYQREAAVWRGHRANEHKPFEFVLADYKPTDTGQASVDWHNQYSGDLSAGVTASNARQLKARYVDVGTNVPVVGWVDGRWLGAAGDSVDDGTYCVVAVLEHTGVENWAVGDDKFCPDNPHFDPRLLDIRNKPHGLEGTNATLVMHPPSCINRTQLCLLFRLQ